jgi:LPXTG-site transpeptidase (sortase) family protein
VDETWVYTCSVTAVAGTTTNTAGVTTTELPTTEEDDAEYFGEDAEIVANKTDALFTDQNNNNLVEPGDVIRYTVMITNNGDGDASDVLFADTPDANTTLVAGSVTTTSGSVTSGNAGGDTSVGVDIGTILSGQTVTITFDVVVNGNLPAEVISVSNQGTVTGSNIPNTPTNDPDTPAGDDPTTTPISQTPNVFDPPSGRKTFNADGLPEMEFTMVWINDGNAVAINVQVTDEIPVGTTYVPGSVVCTPRGASSTAPAATAPLNIAGVVPTSACGYDPATNRVQWQGSIAADPGATDEASALNEVVITFRVTVDDSTNQVFNRGFARTDLNNDGEFNEPAVPGSSLVNSNQTVWTRSSDTTTPQVRLPARLPATGFAPNVTTILPEQPAEMNYASTDVWLEIPNLRVGTSIVGVPLAQGDWNVDWLGRQAGWLEGTAFPSWNGNSVLTGHVTLADGTAGPFASLGSLKWGDRVIVHAYGYTYTYEVRENKVVSPNNTSSLKHEDDPWLTLITCKDYNETTGVYANRISVRAVLISVQKSPQKSIPLGAR